MPPQAQVSVTGYSLGGHLATAFNLIRQDKAELTDVVSTYTFNGAGDNKIETFSFSALVNSFDQARVANPRLNRWNLMNGALNAHLGGSNDAALGGDLAYQYGMAGDLTSMGIDAAQALLANAQLNTSAQRLQSVASLGAGQQRLS